ncbi:Membrane protein related to metalloendopeptidase [Hahella chejuensis KCTC 2396]|uniref:Membrane protein related to metalloendopeptidase n=1 Tax=Hahella chejuensis (strain KCTC 2396) TaxID=349521 RepID=Q2S8S6_HAHCH|nr:M23 family metallopeptidase [Hahella chejuensis]ABC32948.1 Membrane protein related to metalloendopeptidase [Hahella chejuensis KCTC 2396]
MKYLRYLTLATACLCAFSSAAQTVYKYQDASGRWHFTDKAPQQGKHEQVKLSSSRDSQDKPSITSKIEDNVTILTAVNPWRGPVQFLLQIRKTGEYQRDSILVEADSTRHFKIQGQVDYQYYYIPGDPEAKPDYTVIYSPPFASGESYMISQGFNGQFSHMEEPNTYAVDIAMPVGSYIHAARGGVVMAVEENYSIGSAAFAYFLDKANFVMVLHDDGTTGMYAHILQGSLQVRPGDRVERGQALARSGSTGFSTGPHLHFVVRRNVGLDLQSLRFRMQDAEGNDYPIRERTRMVGW